MRYVFVLKDYINFITSQNPIRKCSRWDGNDLYVYQILPIKNCYVTEKRKNQKGNHI